jgi:hypothetical protein
VPVCSERRWEYLSGDFSRLRRAPRSLRESMPLRSSSCSGSAGSDDGVTVFDVASTKSSLSCNPPVSMVRLTTYGRQMTSRQLCFASGKRRTWEGGVFYPVRRVSARRPALSVPAGRATVVRHHNLLELVDRRIPRHDEATAAGQLDATRCTRTRSARSRSCPVAVGGASRQDERLRPKM